ncbi:translation initiation factor IF-2-like [Canis lupus familiaris]|uniref:translation initiation factor IF-2-like n=1 Tax=Canis lupus familiaris TaxID=9615 RepID=UPI0015F156CC|nr:translation initiation factor IF-2-like [Canis lupus familiaris]XP_038428733.1 translation initiation factor IF-2-like [Canis lupus familiaris]
MPLPLETRVTRTVAGGPCISRGRLGAAGRWSCRHLPLLLPGLAGRLLLPISGGRRRLLRLPPSLLRPLPLLCTPGVSPPLPGPPERCSQQRAVTRAPGGHRALPARRRGPAHLAPGGTCPAPTRPDQYQFTGKRGAAFPVMNFPSLPVMEESPLFPATSPATPKPGEPRRADTEQRGLQVGCPPGGGHPPAWARGRQQRTGEVPPWPG